MTKVEKAKHEKLLELLRDLTMTLSSQQFLSRRTQPIDSPYGASATDDLLERAFAAIKENGK